MEIPLTRIGERESSGIDINTKSPILFNLKFLPEDDNSLDVKLKAIYLSKDGNDVSYKEIALYDNYEFTPLENTNDLGYLLAEYVLYACECKGKKAPENFRVNVFWRYSE